MAGKFLAEVQSFRERLLPRGELSRSDLGAINGEAKKALKR